MFRYARSLSQIGTLLIGALYITPVLSLPYSMLDARCSMVDKAVKVVKIVKAVSRFPRLERFHPASSIQYPVYGSTQQNLFQSQAMKYETAISQVAEYEEDAPSSSYSATRDEPSILDAGIRMTVSLLLVLALIVAGIFLLRKMTPYKRLMSNAKHPILVLSRISLGQKKSICLVKVAGEILVIGLTNTNMSILSKINADDYYGEGKAKAPDIHEAEAYAGAGHQRSFRSLIGILRTKVRRQDNEF